MSGVAGALGFCCGCGGIAAAASDGPRSPAVVSARVFAWCGVSPSVSRGLSTVPERGVVEHDVSNGVQSETASAAPRPRLTVFLQLRPTDWPSAKGVIPWILGLWAQLFE